MRVFTVTGQSCKGLVQIDIIMVCNAKELTLLCNKISLVN